MTTISFLPNNANTPPFQATITLDGNSYSLTTMWNLYSSRWYITLVDQNATVIVNQPLIGSPPNADIPLAPGKFTTSTLVYRVSTGRFEIGP